ncbi:aminoglycoside phosphotransferase family protein [Longispora sp. NPDC051575]|uniref:aminoglycoside phosphotransferase family protein n=1 Tax=Longispora sp. NPDC051575 TaxID=3154943 RepID=UPI00343E47DA
MRNPGVGYTSTAVRPDWNSLPAAVRALVADRLGGPVTAGPPAGGGFSGGFASVVRGPAGALFVKAVSATDNPVIADCYRREAKINKALPIGVPVPRVHWLADTADWVILALDAIEGARMPGPDDLDRVLAAWHHVIDALATPPRALLDVGLRTAEEDNGPAFAGWRRIAAGEVPDRILGDWFPRDLIVPLAHLENDWATATAGTAVVHHDLRMDNVVLDAAGAPWFCDWNWPSLAASWFDLPALLVPAYAAGRDTSALLARQPALSGVTPDQVDALLAAVAGYWAVAGSHEYIPGSPWLRQHQTWSGEATVRWIAERRGWRVD